MDRFQEMRTFAAVVEAGSFVGAADALELSKPAVSRQVAELEARLGVRLLHRTTRKLSLTEEGEVFYARCRELLAGLEEAEAEVTERSGQAVGVLKVSAPVSFGLLHLAPLWGGFLAANPQLTLELNLSDRMVDLLDEGLDVAVRIARLPSSSLVSRKLSSTRLVLCASPRYLKQHGKPRRLEDLSQHQVLAYSLLATGDSWEFQGPEGPVAVRVQPRMRSNSGDTCRAIALAHQGIVLQPSFLVGDDLRSGALVEVLPEYRTQELGIYAVYPTRKHVAPKVRLLIDLQGAGGKARRLEEYRRKAMKKTLLLMGCVLALPALAATDLFARMDVDKDGRVSAQEHAMGSRGMFVAMDADKDERVTAAEMTAAHSKITGESDSGGMTSAEKIRVVDGDGDGVLTAAEHAAGSKAMFAKMDRNNDGRLSRREFNAEHEKLTAARR